MDRVRVEKAGAIGDENGAISRRPAIDEATLWAGLSTLPAGASTGRHHHGKEHDSVLHAQTHIKRHNAFAVFDLRSGPTLADQAPNR
jgi:hypothetical protein